MDKLFKNTPYKILELFLDSSQDYFHIREIARTLKLSHATIIKYIPELENLGLIEKNTTTLYPTYKAVSLEPKFLQYKKQHILKKIKDTGIVEFIFEKTFANSIILFGSCAKGEYRQDSDIDIFVEAEEIPLSLSKFEKQIDMPINLLFEPKITDLSDGLRYNILSGTALYGFPRV